MRPPEEGRLVLAETFERPEGQPGPVPSPPGRSASRSTSGLRLTPGTVHLQPRLPPTREGSVVARSPEPQRNGAAALVARLAVVFSLPADGGLLHEVIQEEAATWTC